MKVNIIARKLAYFWKVRFGLVHKERNGLHSEKLFKEAAREKCRLAPTAYQYKTQLLWRFTITMCLSSAAIVVYLCEM